MIKWVVPAVLLLFVMACKEEELQLDYTEIQAFRYQDQSGNVLQAAIDSDTIYLYWPPLQSRPTSIVPKIDVHESTKVVPASDVEIDLTGDIKYQVTAQNGAKRTYTVKLVLNQPYPYITTYSNVLSANGNRFWVNTGNIQLVGDYLQVPGEETVVWLTPKGGAPFKGNIISNNGARLVLGPPANGVYSLSVDVGIRKLPVPFEVEVIDPFVTPRITSTVAPISVKKGATITLAGRELSGVTEANLNNYDTGHFLEVVSATDTEVTFRIPDSVPAGSYSRLSYTYKSGRYYTAATLYIYFTAGRTDFIVTE